MASAGGASFGNSSVRSSYMSKMGPYVDVVFRHLRRLQVAYMAAHPGQERVNLEARRILGSLARLGFGFLP